MSQEKEQKQSKLPLYLSISVVVGLLLLYFLVPAVNEFSKQAWGKLSSENEKEVSQWVEQFGWWGPLFIVFAMVAQMFLLVVPTPLLMVVSVLAYGPWKGGIIILVAIFCASSAAYGIGAYFGTPLIKRLLGQKTKEKVEGYIEDYGFWAVIVTRLSPFLSNDAISFVAGILRMGYWRFIGATIIGILPLTALIAYLGENNNRLINGLIWVSVISLLGFVAYVWWDRRRKNRQ
ncbi:MAG TPA: TVP38/TMEM64 family protein [Cyclobacteriaceae bacterium]|nr:TVP38/TMEM64 family protein [Cyclobacteriaceae bacterium]